MEHTARRLNRDRSLLPFILALGFCAAACSTDDAARTEDGALQGGDGGAAGSAGDGDSGPSEGEPTDPEAALAAIPEAMRPTVLLDELEAHVLAPDVAKGGLALFSDVVTIEPGQDVTFCTYTEVVTDEVTYVHDTLGVQTLFGHHAILQYLAAPQEPGTRECPEASDLAMQLGNILGGTGGEGTSAITLPGNVVSEIPAGAQLVINHHWINAGSEPIEAQTQIVTVPPASEEDLVIARGMTVVLTQFEVAPGDASEHSGECEVPHDMRLITMLGHQHEWGTHVRADRLGATDAMIFDHDFEPYMISEPLTADFPLDEPFVFSQGDRVRMSCQWENTTDQALVFPREMCVFFGWQIGAEKDDICYDGTWL